MPSESSKAEPPERERRRFQFSLPTLMIGVTLLAVDAAVPKFKSRCVSRASAEFRAFVARVIELAFSR